MFQIASLKLKPKNGFDILSSLIIVNRIFLMHLDITRC